MSQPGALERRLASWPCALLALVTANVTTFFQHYRGVSHIPFDFPMSYYGFVAYWTTAVQQRALPEWMPFEEMGYPFFANLQTGIAYPPLWIFPATGLDYTMHAAVVTQVLHVLFGAIGAYALGRVLFGQSLAALLLGIGYHFFGGFYGNAQHPDIIRSFAWLPWLLLCVQLVPGQTKLALRNYALPFAVLCTITGGYPGNTASHLFVTGVFVLAQAATKPRPKLVLPVALFALMVVGIVLAAPMLGPGVALKHTLVRSVQQHPDEMPWTLTNWSYLVLPWHQFWAHTDDLQMVPAFIPVPAIVLLMLLRRERVRSLVPWLVLLAAALCMLPGNYSRVARMLYRVVPTLGLSRFPSSDYRALLVLGLLVLAAASLHDVLARPDEVRALVRARIALPAILFFFFLTGQSGIRVFVLDLVVLGAMLTLAVLLVLGTARGTPRARTAAAYGLLGLSVISALAVLHRAEATWHAENIRAMYMRGIGHFPDGPLAVAERFTHPPASRPARHDTPNVLQFSWRGYLDGTYESRDTDSPAFLGVRTIQRDPELFAFMSEPWRAIAIAPNASPDVACDAAQRAMASPGSTARSLRYRVDGASIAVSLTAPTTIVENETYFPGWEGRILRRGRPAERITARAVCDSLRAWTLPAGEYVLETRYRTPLLRESLRVGLGALVLYALFVVGMLVRDRRASQRIATR